MALPPNITIRPLALGEHQTALGLAWTELDTPSAIHEPHLLKDRASAYRGISGEQFHGSKAS